MFDSFSRHAPRSLARAVRRRVGCDAGCGQITPGTRCFRISLSSRPAVELFAFQTHPCVPQRTVIHAVRFACDVVSSCSAEMSCQGGVSGEARGVVSTRTRVISRGKRVWRVLREPAVARPRTHPGPRTPPRHEPPVLSWLWGLREFPKSGNSSKSCRVANCFSPSFPHFSGGHFAFWQRLVRLISFRKKFIKRMQSSAPPAYDGMDIVRPSPAAKGVATQSMDPFARGVGVVQGSPRGHFSYPGTSSGASDASSPYSSLSAGGSRHGSFVSQTGGVSSAGSPDRWKVTKKNRTDGDGAETTTEIEPRLVPAAAAPVPAPPRPQSVDELLRDSVLSFHRDGPLVNPLGTRQSHGSGSGGWRGPAPRVSSTKDKMQFVADAKGFDYGILWKRRLIDTYSSDDSSAGGTLEYDVGMDANPGTNNALALFIDTSRSMYPSWAVGFGAVGRVGYTGNYEWHETIESLPAWSFQRLRQAKHAGIRSIICVPTKLGVVEFGATRVMPHNVNTVQYVQKLMGRPPETSGHKR